MEERDRRSDEKQNDVERQDVEIAKLVGEQNETDMRSHRIVEDGRGVMPIEQIGRVEKKRGRREKRDCHLGDENLRDINMKGACWQRARRAIDENAQCATGEKHKKFGRIRQRHIAEREALEINPRNVVDKNRNEGEAAPEIDLVGCAHRLSNNVLRPAISRGEGQG